MNEHRASDRGDRAGAPPALPGSSTQHRLQDRGDPAGRDVAGSSGMPDLEIGQFSHPGRKRTNNEDWLGTFQPEDATRLAQKGRMFLLADGMGGHQSGEMASRQAVDRAIRSYMEHGGPDVAASLQRAVEAANAVLYNAARTLQKGQNSGTTLVAGVIRRGELWVANVGDSRAYLLHHGALAQISEDHSWAAAGERAGLGEEWVGRHVLTRALGTKPHVEVDLFGPLPLEVGDRLILCSDGLTTPLSDVEIRDIAGRYPPQRASEALIQAANERGGPDNVSALVVEVKGPGQGRAPVSAGQNLPSKLSAGVERVLRLVPGDLHLSPALIAAAVLAAIILVGLGFALGLLLIGH